MKISYKYFLLIILGFLVITCGGKKGTRNSNAGQNVADSVLYNPDWRFESHGKSAHNYTEVFPQNRMNTIEIEVDSTQWSKLSANMNELYGVEFGNAQMGRPPKETTKPDYVGVIVKYNGKVWKDVGFRLKGNSSLTHSWSSGATKLPFKLNFDKYEDSIPAIHNQRFYGFNKLSFSPAFKDASLMREKLASDLFRMAGGIAAQTAFYKVYLNHGDGSQYCGVYTVVEYPDDNMLKAQLGEEKGNLYKPTSRLANFNEEEFEKKNNQDTADYNDVQKLIETLNSPLRTSNPADWRQKLEEVIDMDQYINFLAVNVAIENWDSYGSMPHNYYLYNHSEKHLVWIPWDHNEVFSTGGPGMGGEAFFAENRMPERPGKEHDGKPNHILPANMKPGMMPEIGDMPDMPPPNGQPGPPPHGEKVGFGGSRGLSLGLEEVSSGNQWPLLKAVKEDEMYYSQYIAQLHKFNDEVFTIASMDSLLASYSSIIETVLEEEKEPRGKNDVPDLQEQTDFEQARLALENKLHQRKKEIIRFLN